MITLVLFVNEGKIYYNNTTIAISIICGRLWNFSQSQSLNNKFW
jgi:glucose uptake protein GlcU